MEATQERRFGNRGGEDGSGGLGGRRPGALQIPQHASVDDVAQAALEDAPGLSLRVPAAAGVGDEGLGPAR